MAVVQNDDVEVNVQLNDLTILEEAINMALDKKLLPELALDNLMLWGDFMHFPYNMQTYIPLGYPIHGGNR